MSDLMNLDDIAEMYKCSRNYARDTLVRQPGFPDPAHGSTAKHRVWVRREVRAFAMKRPAQIPFSVPQAA